MLKSIKTLNRNRDTLTFSSNGLYEKCLNIIYTMYIFKTTNNEKFGGYTEQTWDRSNTSSNYENNIHNK